MLERCDRCMKASVVASVRTAIVPPVAEFALRCKQVFPGPEEVAVHFAIHNRECSNGDDSSQSGRSRHRELHLRTSHSQQRQGWAVENHARRCRLGTPMAVMPRSCSPQRCDHSVRERTSGRGRRRRRSKIAAALGRHRGGRALRECLVYSPPVRRYSSAGNARFPVSTWLGGDCQLAVPFLCMALMQTMS